MWKSSKVGNSERPAVRCIAWLDLSFKSHRLLFLCVTLSPPEILHLCIAEQCVSERLYAVEEIWRRGASFLACVLELRVNQPTTHLKQLDDLLHHS